MESFACQLRNDLSNQVGLSNTGLTIKTENKWAACFFGHSYIVAENIVYMVVVIEKERLCGDEGE